MRRSRFLNDGWSDSSRDRLRLYLAKVFATRCHRDRVHEGQVARYADVAALSGAQYSATLWASRLLSFVERVHGSDASARLVIDISLPISARRVSVSHAHFDCRGYHRRVVSLSFSLHREVAGNDYLALYDLLKLPATKARIGFLEVPLHELEGDGYAQWAAEVVDGADDSLWDSKRIETELARLEGPASMLPLEESAVLRETMQELLPAVAPARCWLQIRVS